VNFVALPEWAMETIHESEVVTDKSWAVISITHVDGAWPEITETDTCEGVLQLLFADIDEPRGEYVLFDENHAEQILNFVKQMDLAKVNTLIVHCKAGYSRSPAVAAALSEIYDQKSDAFFQYCRPNMHVYKLLLNTHHRSED
jgi:predicted protein tyrosine phosphatase